MANRNIYKYLILGRGKSCLGKNTKKQKIRFQQILTSSIKMIGFYNKHSEFLWLPTCFIPLFAQSFTFIRMCRDNMRKIERNQLGSLILRSTILMVLSPNLSFVTMLIALNLKNTIDAARSASYFDLHVEIDSDGR